MGVKLRKSFLDRWENLDAAEQIGIKVIRFESVKELHADLEKIGFEILPKLRVNG